MDNNVIVSVNLMRACTLHNVGHENNINSPAIAWALFAFYREQEQKDKNERFHYCKYILVNY